VSIRGSFSFAPFSLIMPAEPKSDPIHADNANLPHSIFTNVNLGQSKFDDVNLSGTKFNNINFSGTTIRDANLSEVSIEDANYTGMKIDGILVTDLLRLYHKQAGS
jgi:hypothetical protein